MHDHSSETLDEYILVVVLVVFLNQWTKTQSVTIQMKTLDEYILVVVLVCNSEPVDENSRCNHSNEKS